MKELFGFRILHHADKEDVFGQLDNSVYSSPELAYEAALNYAKSNYEAKYGYEIETWLDENNAADSYIDVWAYPEYLVATFLIEKVFYIK